MISVVFIVSIEAADNDASRDANDDDASRAQAAVEADAQAAVEANAAAAGDDAVAASSVLVPHKIGRASCGTSTCKY